MYRINITDENTLRAFLLINDNEYIDAIIKGNKTILVSNTREIFAALQLDTIAIDTTEQLMLRVPRKLLLDLFSVGHILVDTSDTEATLDFFELHNDGGTERTCTVTFTKQDIWVENYTDKLELLSAMDMSAQYDLSNIKELIKVGSTFKTIIDCNSGIACIHVNNNCKVFRRIDPSINFSMAASTINTLVKMSNKVFDYKNYLGAHRDGFTILCTKTRGNTNADYALIDEEKSSFRADVDLRFLQRFLAKVKIDTKVVEVDLESNKSVIESGSKKYAVPIMIRNLEKSAACKSCIVNMEKVFLDVVNKVLSSNIVKLYNKRTFVQIQDKDTSIIFRS